MKCFNIAESIDSSEFGPGSTGVVVRCGPKHLCSDCRDSAPSAPESGKIYRLTGGSNVASIARGDDWAASEVAPDGATPIRLDRVVRGDYIRRKADSKKTYTRGAYVRDEGLNRYECNDVDDISRSIFLKGSTMVYVGFTY